MPIYEYKCEACGHRMEAIQKMSDPALTECPSCAAPELKKLVSAAGFRLKGSGWYETDFKAGDKKNLAKSEDATPSSGKKDTKSSNGAAAAKKTAAKDSSSKSTGKSKKKASSKK